MPTFFRNVIRVNHLFFILGGFFILHAFSNECTEMCDVNHVGGIQLKICGTDLATHETHYEAFDTKCYGNCGVMMYYPGPCGCPNDCFSNSKQGICGIEQICECTEGWGGPDCSQPILSNNCSGHGSIATSSEMLFNYCLCDVGWTGIDCSSKVQTVGNAPWGNIFGESTYTSYDIYKDDHPLWNVSVFATIRVTINVTDLLGLLYPWNLYNESYANCSVFFDNGAYQTVLHNTGFRIKGTASRQDQKKGWNLKFNEFVKGQKLFDVEKIGLKSGSVSDDTFLKNKLYADLSHALGVPTQRATYALLYVNSIYYGLYYMHEDIDSAFLQSRLEGDDGQGNIMKLQHGVHLQYYGSNTSWYQEQGTINSMGKQINLFFYFETAVV
jgi:hypothetical protein